MPALVKIEGIGEHYAEKLAQARNRDLADQDDKPGDDVHIANKRSGEHALGCQHQDDGGDHDLVGDWVEEHAKPL